MYVEKGKHIEKKDFLPIFRQFIEDQKQNKYLSSKERSSLKNCPDYQIESVANQLVEINAALLSDRSVFALCEKYPKNLDSGKHYYSIYYIDAEGKTNIIWGGEFLYFLIGQDRQDRDRNLRRYIFSSRAIGMSRVLDATDSFFRLLKKFFGTYGRIEVL